MHNSLSGVLPATPNALTRPETRTGSSRKPRDAADILHPDGIETHPLQRQASIKRNFPTQHKAISRSSMSGRKNAQTYTLAGLVLLLTVTLHLSSISPLTRLLIGPSTRCPSVQPPPEQ
ncbi:hypothetical protein E2C01_025924 [Portunus trituberculatus]|uniref:Uncharacterized protein n=1 Tax=Portunus trituberculatus TaxID=210409 RepID=A0A5B7EGT7_PORTR|nr:hypothetical protein [Portunus trituberculatus]